MEVAQRRGTEALQAAQRRSSALSFKARQAAEARLEGVAVKVIGALDQVEQAASERVGRTLNRLGIPSQKDIEKLTRSVSKLSTQIDKLAQDAAKAERSPAVKAKPRTKAAAPVATRRRAAATEAVAGAN